MKQARRFSLVVLGLLVASQPLSSRAAPKRATPSAALPTTMATTDVGLPPPARVQMPERMVSGRRRPKIVIVGMGARFAEVSWPQVEERTSAELSTLGFNVVRVAGQVAGTDAQLAELGTQAAEQGAIAAIRIVRKGSTRAVQVWIYDALTRKMVLRKTPLSRSAITGDTAALQVVELLYASLLEVRIARKRTAARKVPPLVERLVARKLKAESVAGSEQELPRYSLSASGVVSSLGEGLDPTFAVAVAFSYRLTRAVWVGSELTMPLSSTRLDDRRGETRVIGGTARLLALLEPYAESRFSPALGLAFGALLLRAAGDAAAGGTDAVEWSVVPLAGLRAQLGVWVVKALRVYLAAAAAYTLPSVVIRHDGDTLATAGRPLLDARLGVQWLW